MSFIISTENKRSAFLISIVENFSKILICGDLHLSINPQEFFENFRYKLFFNDEIVINGNVEL